MWFNYVAVAAGGAIGCVARYGLTQLIQLVWGRNFPVATRYLWIMNSLIVLFVLTCH